MNVNDLRTGSTGQAMDGYLSILLNQFFRKISFKRDKMNIHVFYAGQGAGQNNCYRLNPTSWPVERTWISAYEYKSHNFFSQVKWKLFFVGFIP
jgi:hypothetical protein